MFETWWKNIMQHLLGSGVQIHFELVEALQFQKRFLEGEHFLAYNPQVIAVLNTQPMPFPFCLFLYIGHYSFHSEKNIIYYLFIYLVFLILLFLKFVYHILLGFEEMINPVYIGYNYFVYSHLYLRYQQTHLDQSSYVLVLHDVQKNVYHGLTHLEVHDNPKK